MSQENQAVNHGAKSDLVTDLMEINNLQYSIGRSLSVCTSSNYVYEPLNISGVASGPNRTVQRTLNTGASFVKGRHSYLAMKVKFLPTLAGVPVAFVPRAGATPADNYATFGEGSVLNLIEEVTLRTKDGVEVHVDRQAHDLNNILYYYENSSDYIKHAGSAMGITHGEAEHGADSLDTAPLDQLSREKLGEFLAGGQQFIIPMSAISRLFAYDKLLPSQLMSGLSVSIKFRNTADAFVWIESNPGQADGFTYEISDAYLRVATCDLSDSMQSKIATMSESKGGLKILIDDFHHEKQTGVTSQANVNVRANIAQALQMIVKPTFASDLGDIKEDPFSGNGCNVQRYYFRHGSTQYPKTEIKDGPETFKQAMNAFKKTHGESETGAVSYLGWFEKARVVSYNFERGEMELNGVALSNSKTITYDANYQAPGGSDTIDVDVWVRHSKLLSVFLNNSVIES